MNAAAMDTSGIAARQSIITVSQFAVNAGGNNVLPVLQRALHKTRAPQQSEVLSDGANRHSDAAEVEGVGTGLHTGRDCYRTGWLMRRVHRAVRSAARTQPISNARVVEAESESSTSTEVWICRA